VDGLDPSRRKEVVLLACGQTVQTSGLKDFILAKVPSKTQAVKTSTIMIISASYGTTLRIANLTLTL